MFSVGSYLDIRRATITVDRALQTQSCQDSEHPPIQRSMLGANTEADFMARRPPIPVSDVNAEQEPQIVALGLRPKIGHSLTLEQLATVALGGDPWITRGRNEFARCSGDIRVHRKPNAVPDFDLRGGDESRNVGNRPHPAIASLLANPQRMLGREPLSIDSAIELHSEERAFVVMSSHGNNRTQAATVSQHQVSRANL